MIEFYNSMDQEFPKQYCPKIDEKKYGYLRRKSFRILLATNLHDDQDTLPSQLLTISELIDYLGPNRVSFHIQEGGSTDITRNVLHHMIPIINQHYAMPPEDGRYQISEERIDWTTENKISITARLRNRLLEPLHHNPDKFKYLLIFEDIGLCARDVLEMIHHHIEQGAHASCSMDWQDHYGMYDVWTFRDIEGMLLQPQSLDSKRRDPSNGDFMRENPFTWARWKAMLPFQVFTCWNGMMLADVKPILDANITFREGHRGECAENEKYLFCKDLWRNHYRKIQMVPTVNVAYSSTSQERTMRRNNEELAEGRDELTRDIVWKDEPPERVFCLSLPHRNGKSIHPWHQLHQWRDPANQRTLRAQGSDHITPENSMHAAAPEEELSQRSGAIVMQYLKLAHAIHHVGSSIRRAENRVVLRRTAPVPIGVEHKPVVPSILLVVEVPINRALSRRDQMLLTNKDADLMPPPTSMPQRKRCRPDTGIEENSRIKVRTLVQRIS
ncbi:hypothetical protein PROFUN_02745 [Planoprotostelium fungivorum]|uniref:Uncharacterized protein n=1 Tax=Planoprotostelium fungivorum TaxID=1890364 RepID=A0A2P6NXI4_9EUKA|nr:hypothetical protein PROFUN_02745 [Planoprotostelium fungivorum]